MIDIFQAQNVCSELYFEEDTHTYRTEQFGIIPSVTTIIKPLTDFEKINKVDLDFACWRGTQVHRATEYVDRGILDIKRIQELNEIATIQHKDPKLMEYIKAYETAKKDLGFKIITSEMRLYSKKMLYAGTIDRVIQIGKKLYVMDIKTGGNFGSWGHQLEAYRMLLTEYFKNTFELSILRLKDDGTYEFTTEKQRTQTVFNQDVVSDKAMFLSLLNIRRSKFYENIKYNWGNVNEFGTSKTGF